MVDGKGDRWLVLVLKDRCANDRERDALRSHLLSAFPLKGDEVRYVPVEDGDAFRNFLFVKEHDPANDLRDILESRRDAFEPYPSHMRITEAEFDRMLEGIAGMKRKESMKHGDIVGIRKGTYSKLNGIVLRRCRNGKLEVGMKFCFGTVVMQYDDDELELKGNIFEHLKVLK